MRDSGEIRGFHAHIYYGTKCGWFDKPDPERRVIAERLHKFLTDMAASHAWKGHLHVGTMHDAPVGPHTQPMFAVEVDPSVYSEVFKLLILNNQGLSILFHPVTGNDKDDHTLLATWLGEKLPLDLDKL